MPRQHGTIEGRVQGVGFRYHANYLANDCHLTGWVENMWDGSVEIEVQGKEEDLDKFWLMLGKQSMFIRIDRMDVRKCKEIQEREFRIRYS